MKFLRNLKDLKMKLRFFSYYRWFIDHYVAIARLLVKLKIKNFINNLMKERLRREYATQLRLQ